MYSRLGPSAFLTSSSQILIYSGSQDNSFIDSTQTFLVSLNPPYNVLSFESAAPPVMKPLMMPYNASHALMLGGESTNSKLYTFSQADKWKKLDVGLASPLQDSSDVQATILQQKDGSKILEIFDMHSTPNQISTLLLQMPHPLQDRHQPSHMHRSTPEVYLSNRENERGGTPVRLTARLIIVHSLLKPHV